MHRLFAALLMMIVMLLLAILVVLHSIQDATSPAVLLQRRLAGTQTGQGNQAATLTQQAPYTRTAVLATLTAYAKDHGW